MTTKRRRPAPVLRDTSVDATWEKLRPALAEIADEYRQWRERDSQRPSTKLLRAELSLLAKRLLATDAHWSGMSDYARGVVRATLAEESRAGLALVGDLEHALQRIASAAINGANGIPERGWISAARRNAVVRLRVLFEESGLEFSATANADGHESLAVRALQAVCHHGDRRISADAARKWIERSPA